MIKLVVLDVDGTLTDGKVSYTQSGDEIKSFCVKDGLAIASWNKLGRHTAIITGRSSAIVSKRAKELGIEHCYQGVEDKKTKLLEILKELKLSMDEVASIGDDLNDYSMLKDSFISFAPNNASAHVKEIVTVVLENQGGKGAVREMFEYLIKAEGLESKYLALWY
jgi:3-deoxy-D-manno-octulosonate 8-phosphate phosphatase (KDO 8-P phosphatase)